MEPHTFESQEAKARLAVARTLEWLASLPETKRVEDVQGEWSWERQGIDLFWHLKDGTSFSIDVKGDFRAWETGNYAFEYLSSIEDGQRGNFLTSLADLWHVHIPQCDQLHIWKLPQLRAWFEGRGRSRRCYRSPNRDYTTWGYLMPVAEALREAPHLIEVVQLPWEGGASGRI